MTKFQLKDSAYYLLYILFGFILGTILLSLLFLDRNVFDVDGKTFILSNWVLYLVVLIITPLVFLGIKKWLKSLKPFDRSKFIKILIVLNLGLFLVQLFVAYSIYFYTGWDANTVRTAAFLMIEHPEDIALNFNTYFSYHVNQMVITVLLGQILRFSAFLGLGNVYVGLLFVNVLIVNLSGLFMTLSVYEITKKASLAFVSWGIFLILGSLSPWIVIPYTDTLSMLFPILAFYLYLKNKPDGLNLIRWFFIVLLTTFGGLIKPQAYIVLIAIILIELYRLLTSSGNNRIPQVLAILLCLYFGANLSYAIDVNIRLSVDFNLLYGRAFTYSHYLMMGLNPDTYGVYNVDDTDLSYATGTVEERQAMNFRVIKERLEDFGFLGLLEFEQKKLVVNFNDGTFAWGEEGGFYVQTFDPMTPASDFLRNIYYHSGDTFEVFTIFMQSIWIFVLLMMTGVFIKPRFSEDKRNVLITTLIGIVFFVQLFEARARYVFAYLPFFVICATLGLSEFHDLAVRYLPISVRSGKIRNENQN